MDSKTAFIVYVFRDFPFNIGELNKNLSSECLDEKRYNIYGEIPVMLITSIFIQIITILENVYHIDELLKQCHAELNTSHKTIRIISYKYLLILLLLFKRVLRTLHTFGSQI